MEEFLEGRTKLLLANYVWDRAPRAGEVFFNPFIKTVRDLSVLVCKAYGKLYGKFTLGDALAGMGARALRVANEVNECEEAHMNDKSYLAIDYAKRSASANKIINKCVFTNYDACYFLINHEDRFDIVEIDPFGSPSPYLDCAFKAIRDEGMLCITGTDVTALCGVYRRVALRRYFGYSLNTEFNHEIAVRLLLGLSALMGARLDLGIEPLFSHFTRNHARIYFKVIRGANLADQTLNSLGYILYCFNCLYRESSKGLKGSCPICGSSLSFAGPLWLGKLHDENFIDAMLERCPQEFKDAKNIVKRAKEEVNLPASYYKLDYICKKLKIPCPKVSKVIEELIKLGYRASRTLFDGNSIKSDAPIKVIKDVILKLVP